MHSRKYLFSPKDINIIVEESTRLNASATIGDRRTQATYYNKAARFAREMEILFTWQKQAQTTFVTSGTTKLHNIVEMLVDTYGPCREMFISGWDIAGAPALALLDLMERGQLLNLFHSHLELSAINAVALRAAASTAPAAGTPIAHAIITLRCKDETLTITTLGYHNSQGETVGFVSRSKHTYYAHIESMKQGRA